MCEQTLPRQAQVVLTATMHDVGINCVNLGHVELQLHFTCSATLFLSFEVRACCDFAVDFASKKVVSVVAIFKIEVALSRRLPTVACIATRNQTCAPYLSIKLSILLHANLP